MQKKFICHQKNLATKKKFLQDNKKNFKNKIKKCKLNKLKIIKNNNK